MTDDISDGTKLPEITGADFLFGLPNEQIEQNLEGSSPIDCEESMFFTSGADECEHLRKMPEMEEYEMILGTRRLVQNYEYSCALEYSDIDCPMAARACKMKIEIDNNSSDIASISLIELGTSDIKVHYYGDDMDLGYDNCDEDSD